MIHVKAEDLLPGMTILWRAKNQTVAVDTVKIALYHPDTWQKSPRVPMVQINSDDYGPRFLLGEPVPVIAKRPEIKAPVFHIKSEAWQVFIESEGDLRIYVNGEELSTGVIRVQSERGEAVKEIGA